MTYGFVCAMRTECEQHRDRASAGCNWKGNRIKQLVINITARVRRRTFSTCSFVFFFIGQKLPTGFAYHDSARYSDYRNRESKQFENPMTGEQRDCAYTEGIERDFFNALFLFTAGGLFKLRFTNKTAP